MGTRQNPRPSKARTRHPLLRLMSTIGLGGPPAKNPRPSKARTGHPLLRLTSTMVGTDRVGHPPRKEAAILSSNSGLSNENSPNVLISER